MDAIKNISKDVTIIMIAHRLNTVKNCDIIYKLENGEVINNEIKNNKIKNKINILPTTQNP